MLASIIAVIEESGVESGSVEELAKRVFDPAPGTFDPAELESASKVQIALLASIVAAANRQQFGDSLEPLLDYVAARTNQLGAFDQARFWHLKGVSVWRSHESVYTATRAFNSSIEILIGLEAAGARNYLPRVLDTYGQFLNSQGLTHDARREFETSLGYREALNDQVGMAITLGNLGRLCMDTGDFAAAAEYLGRDLEIVEGSASPMVGIQIQLLSHLGTCNLELGRIGEARALFQRNAELAQTEHDAVGSAYAALGLGKIALELGDRVQAEEQLRTARTNISRSSLQGDAQNSLEALMHQFAGEIAQEQGALEKALEDFRQAQELFARVSNTSPVKIAHLLRDHARAALANNQVEQAVSLLRQALHELDPTAAEAMRQSIEEELQELSRDSWLLHAAGRFVGQDQIEFLLSEAGRGGFRGANKEVAILFSDIRGFTSISEQFSPADLVVFLNDYLGHMTRCVQQYGGMVDKFIGDAVMAIFSMPDPRPDDAERALMSALLMSSELARFNRAMPEGTPRLAAGIGVHFGSVVAGLIGSPQKRSYTVIGDAVNTGSRLEGMTKMLGASILVSGELLDRLPDPDRFIVRPLGRYLPKGRAQPVAVFDLMGEDDGSAWQSELKEEIAEIRAAFDFFEKRDFARAVAGFEALAARTAQTKRADGYQFLIAEIQALVDAPPPPSWDGSIVLTEK